jgi:filamentous hemagglutinin family protein
MVFFRRTYSRRAAFLAAAPLLAARIACAEPAASALPTGFSGRDGVNTPVITGNTMTINQSAAQAVIDWQSFNIGRDAHVDFKQPANGVTVNRVMNGSGDPTQIYGKLTANGTVFILDRNGVIFGKTAQVDTAALIASTGDLSRQTGTGITLENIDANPLAYIENHGSVTVADGGLAAFVAPAVRNSGVIRARLGTAVLASGKTVTMYLHGDGLWSVAVPEALTQGIAEARNSGAIYADGGHIYLTVRAARGAADEVINNTGLLSAQRFSQRDGKIMLHGGGHNKALENALHVGTAANVQQALDQAADDGSTTLHLQSGVYTAPLIVSKSLTIHGDNGSSTRIEGDGNTPALTVAAHNVTVQFLHIIGGVIAEGVQNLRIINNIFTQSGAAAVHLLRTAAAEITGNTFSYSGEGGPIRLTETQQTTISGNMYLGSGDYGALSDNDTSLQFSDDMFSSHYAQWLVRIVARAIDDSRLRLGLPRETPPDNTVDITIIDPAATAAIDPAALAAIAPASGSDDGCSESEDCL